MAYRRRKRLDLIFSSSPVPGGSRGKRQLRGAAGDAGVAPPGKARPGVGGNLRVHGGKEENGEAVHT